MRDKKCATCAYSFREMRAPGSRILCQYILIEHRRRPCPPEECVQHEIYRPRKRKRNGFRETGHVFNPQGRNYEQVEHDKAMDK